MCLCHAFCVLLSALGRAHGHKLADDRITIQIATSPRLVSTSRLLGALNGQNHDEDCKTLGHLILEILLCSDLKSSEPEEDA